MYLDIAAANSYGRYNIKFAKIVGLNTAVYWSCLMNVLERVSKKKTYDAAGFFTLSRSYVEEQTTLSKDKQLECDAVLKQLGLINISPDNVNKICCDVKAFFTLITEEDIKAITEISKVAKSQTKESKAEGKKAGIIHRLQNRVTATNPELYTLYCELVETTYAKGMTTNAQIDLFQDAVNSYTSDDLVKIEILKIAVAGSYRIADWAIEQYEKKSKSKVGTRLGTQKIGSSVSSDIEF